MSKPTLTSQQAIDLLELLIDDADFRQQFQQDPLKALGQVGYRGALPTCLKVDKLAPAEELRKARSQLLDRLGGKVAMAMSLVFMLEAGQGKDIPGAD